MTARVASLLVVTLLCGGCSGGEPEFAGSEAAMRVAAAPAPPPQGVAELPPALEARKLIRTVQLRLIVADTDDAEQRAERIAAELGGYVGDTSAWRDEGVMHRRLTLRVPAESLDAAVAALQALAVRVESESQSVRDVTAEYVDVDARLRTLQLTEQELQALLAESRARSSDVEGIMAIYRELVEIRSQIESYQGRLNVLDSQVSLSTIDLELSPDPASLAIDAGEWRPLAVARDSVRTLVSVLQGMANLAIFFAIVGLPVLGILWVSWRGVRRLRRWRRAAPSTGAAG